MSEYDRLYALAREKGWRTPVNPVFPADSWILYWQACERYLLNPAAGRPIPPHRSA